MEESIKLLHYEEEKIIGRQCRTIIKNITLNAMVAGYNMSLKGSLLKEVIKYYFEHEKVMNKYKVFRTILYKRDSISLTETNDAYIYAHYKELMNEYFDDNNYYDIISEVWLGGDLAGTEKISAIAYV